MHNALGSDEQPGASIAAARLYVDRLLELDPSSHCARKCMYDLKNKHFKKAGYAGHGRGGRGVGAGSTGQVQGA